MKSVFSLTLLSTPLQYTPKIAAGLQYIFLAITFHMYGPAQYIFLEIPFHRAHRCTGSSEKKGQSAEEKGSQEDANPEVNQGLFKEATRRALSRKHQFPCFSG